jgi:hypothetical protein
MQRESIDKEMQEVTFTPLLITKKKVGERRGSRPEQGLLQWGQAQR